ncbi:MULTISPECIES: polysaccharide deacetylase family protein [Micromonospora]|uniref:Polysaccharide deacetylase family protein n=1 Tax=Micromonospora antibiotica TaxID=2807623 RepID=A0ABS3V0W0_9ACTN|nr:polysaccharide deacetylase family protein [Micromonospora antibiotica]MBO4159243.1 polysaccharide deacetylase family protein [Micromonospora antibiotica]
MISSTGDSGHPSRSRASRLTVRLAVLATTVALGAVGVAVSATPSSAAACNGYVGLTFDDGPTGSTGALLNVLRANNVRATMFNVGQNVQGNPSAARAQVDAGMWIGNHSWNHAHMTSMGQSQMQSDLSQTNSAIQSATGVRPQLFRPPYGETNSTLQSVASSLGMRQVIWDVDSQDWNGASVSQIVANAGRLQNGQVILMHDGIQNTRDAIPQIMANLNSRGLCPGMISPSTGRAVAPDGTPPTNPPTTPPTGTPTTPPAGGTCTATATYPNVWGDRYNTSVTVQGGSNWTVVVALTAPQKVNTTWNGTPSWDSSGYVMTMRSNGSGNTFGFTTMMNGNSGARPQIRSCTTG